MFTDRLLPWFYRGKPNPPAPFRSMRDLPDSGRQIALYPTEDGLAAIHLDDQSSPAQRAEMRRESGYYAWLPEEEREQ